MPSYCSMSSKHRLEIDLDLRRTATTKRKTLSNTGAFFLVVLHSLSIRNGTQEKSQRHKKRENGHTRKKNTTASGQQRCAYK